MAYNLEKHKEFLSLASNGNEDAYQFLCTMARTFRLWDDCYDQDRDIDKEAADEVFCDLNFTLSRNEFYRKNQDALSAFIFVAWNAWKDSNAWKGSESKLKGTCAWFIRDTCNEIVPLVAFLTGGRAKARAFALPYREFLLNRLAEQGMDGFVKE